MKKLLFICLFFSVRYHAEAQFILIPDSNFRNYIINNIDPAAISGTGLDTTNLNVISAKSVEIDFFNNQITDITGIQYFDSLEVLKINFLGLAFLPVLPPLLERIEASGNAFATLPDLPQGLEYADFSFNALTSLPAMPPSLMVLLVSSNFLAGLNSLPSMLQYLDASNNQISFIDSFPVQLQSLIIWSNQLDTLPALPAILKELNVADNDLAFFPVMPPQLQLFNCSLNPIIDFPQLPNSIIYVECLNTVSCLPPLPNSLQRLSFDGCLSNLPSSLQDYYPLCTAEATFTEVPDSAGNPCNDTLSFDPGFASYLWSTGDTTAVLAGICRGVYSATLTTQSGCIYNPVIDISDTVLLVSALVNTEATCARAGICGYVIDVTVSGGTPPYTYQWSDLNGEIDFTMISDSSQDLIHFCLSDVLSVAEVKCIVTDAAGRVDSVVKTVFDNIPPEPFIIDIVNPVCPGYATGYIYIEDDPLTPGGTVFIMETNLDTGNYLYTVPYGNSCEEVYDIRLDYQFSDCANMYSYDISPADSGLCNGTFDLVDNIDHGIYNLANISLAFDGMYMSDGTPVQATELCNSTWYSFFVFDFNIGYFEQDSIYITVPQFTAVYPGDANNDNTANNVDLLALGLAYNSTGPARSDTSISWSPKNAQLWMGVFSDSTNMCHADVNGNGVVNARDTTGILANYGLTHLRPFLKQGGSPSIQAILPDSIASNAFLEIPVAFSNAASPVDSVLGVAFSLITDPTVIDSNTLRFIPDSSWFAAMTTDAISIQKRNGAAVDVAITRTDHQLRTGSGIIGRLRFRTMSVIDTVYITFSSSAVVYTDQQGDYVAGGDFSDSALIYPAACVLNTQIASVDNCFDLYGGQAEVTIITGNAPYTYDWSVISSELPVNVTDGSPFLDSLPSGTYQVLVSDSAGCSDSLSVSVFSEDGDLITGTFQNPTCQQICDGWIWLRSDTVSGPVFSVTWSTGQTSSIITGLCDGIYTASVTWGESCSVVKQFQLNDPASMSYLLTIDSPSCNLCNGSIVVSAFGGRRPYSFTWTSSDTSFFASDSIATSLCFNNSYEFTLTDACLNLFSQQVMFSTCDSTVSVSDPGEGTDIASIYPNPNDGNFYVKHAKDLNGYFEIRDATGRLVDKRRIVPGLPQSEIRLNNVESGVYIFSIYTEDRVSRLNFVVR